MRALAEKSLTAQRLSQANYLSDEVRLRHFRNELLGSL